MNANETRKERKPFRLYLIRAFVILAVIAAQAFQLNYSAMPSFLLFFGMGPSMICLSVLAVGAVNLLFRLLFRRWESTLLLTSALFLLWSLANYYVIEFHGSPLFISEFINIRAAAAVAGGYHYTIGKAVIGLMLIFAVELVCIGLLSFFLRRPYRETARDKFLCFVLFLAACAAVYGGLLSPVSVKPHSTMGLSWYNGVKDYGFISCTLEDCGKLLHKIEKPEGYSPAAVSAVGDPSAVTVGECPDIILILNETLCDLSVYSDVSEQDIFQPMRCEEQLRFGYAVTPGVGGGTNNSEYELLTSNSAKLLVFPAPFSFLDLEASGENVVRLVRQLGYETYGMHCCSGTNYSRDSAYPALGFDTIIFGKEGFPHYSTYGNRPWLDRDNYLDLINYYENAGQNPRLMFLLTFQNHGGWEQNPAEYDTQHCVADLGSLTDDVEEYLSSVHLSVEAFRGLTDYYSRVDRHVIICMVGDHAPSFISSLPAKRSFSTEEAEIARRLVPYVIWTNYEVEFPEYTEYASMVDLIPMVLKTAGLPLTPYYQYILDLHDVLPIRTSTGIYMDREGNLGVYGESGPYDELLTQYYYMEYNALRAGNDYHRELFEYTIEDEG